MHNKISIYILLMFLLGSLSPISAFDLYESKKLDIKLGILLGIDYSYEATLLPGRGGFELTDSRVKLEGEYLDKLKLSLSVDFSEFEVDSEHINLLKNAYIQYNFADPFRLRAGRFDIPFGEEASHGTGSRANIYHSEASALIAPGRAIGLRVSGKEIFDLFSYSLGAFNGSGSLFQENETGHHIFTGQVNFEKDFFQAGYNILYSTDENFSQGLFIDFNFDIKENITLNFFSEYLEQRYFNYHWNHSVFTLLSLRVNAVQPLIYFDYFNDNVGHDGVEDKWTAGLGFNAFFLNDKLKLMVDLHTNYLFSLENGVNNKFYDNKLTLKMIMEL